MLYRVKINDKRRCPVCNRAVTAGYVVKDEPPLNGFFCSKRCIETAKEQVEKIQAGRVEEVVNENKTKR